MPVKGTQTVRQHFNRGCVWALLDFDSRLNQKLNCVLAPLQDIFFLLKLRQFYTITLIIVFIILLTTKKAIIEANATF